MLQSLRALHRTAAYRWLRIWVKPAFTLALLAAIDSAVEDIR